MTISCLSALLWLALLTAGIAEAGVTQEVKFQKDSNATVIEQSVIRGESDLYYLTARAGQTLTVSLSALEKNAVFTIYRPGVTVTTEPDGIADIKGKTLSGAGESDDATTWKGRLPDSGRYLLVVGGTRGNATYKLKISIR